MPLLKHNMSYTRFYKIFMEIHRRTTNKNCVAYKNYGGKGIKNHFKSFNDFKNKMYIAYKKHSKIYGELDTTIDRIDNNKGYSKSNCRWATMKVQANNRGKFNKIVEKNGQFKNITQWAETLGIKRTTVQSRLGYGWTPYKAVFTKIRFRSKNKQHETIRQKINLVKE